MTRSLWLLLHFFCYEQPFQKGNLCTVFLLGYQYICISVYMYLYHLPFCTTLHNVLFLCECFELFNSCTYMIFSMCMSSKQCRSEPQSTQLYIFMVQKAINLSRCVFSLSRPIKMSKIICFVKYYSAFFDSKTII